MLPPKVFWPMIGRLDFVVISACSLCMAGVISEMKATGGNRAEVLMNWVGWVAVVCCVYEFPTGQLGLWRQVFLTTDWLRLEQALGMLGPPAYGMLYKGVLRLEEVSWICLFLLYSTNDRSYYFSASDQVNRVFRPCKSVWCVEEMEFVQILARRRQCVEWGSDEDLLCWRRVKNPDGRGDCGDPTDAAERESGWQIVGAGGTPLVKAQTTYVSAEIAGYKWRIMGSSTYTYFHYVMFLLYSSQRTAYFFEECCSCLEGLKNS